MFAQTIRGKVSDPKAVDANFNRWSKELAPGAKGWLGTTAGVTDDGQLFIMVRFESAEAARANSERPEQDQFWSETSKQFDGEPTFQDSTDVQVGSGTVSDVDLMLALIEGNSSWRTSRPDILGIVGADFGAGQFTYAAYFTSHDTAREVDDGKNMPLEVTARMDEMTSLVTGELEYLDLKDPWLGWSK